MWKVMKVLSIAFGVIYLFVLQYVYPLMARFENTIKQTLKNALLISIKNMGWTILMILILAAPYAVIYFTNFLPLFTIAYGLVVFLDSYILNRIFEPYVKEAMGEQEEEKDPDYWVIPDEEPEAEVTAEETPELPGDDGAEEKTEEKTEETEENT